MAILFFVLSVITLSLFVSQNIRIHPIEYIKYVTAIESTTRCNKLYSVRVFQTKPEMFLYFTN